MSRRRLWLGSGVGILVLLLLLGGYAGYHAQRLLNEQGIELDWQQLNLSWRGVRLSGLSLQQRGESGHLLLLGGQAQLYWLAPEAPRYRLQLQDVQLDWQAAESTADTPGDNLQQQLQGLAELLPWLPRRVELQRLEAQLPCANGRCTLHGDATLQAGHSDLQLEATLLHDSHRAQLHAELHGLTQAPSGQLQARAELLLDDQPLLRLSSQLQSQVDSTHWSGQLHMPQLGEVAWFGDWLSQWLLIDPSPLPATPQQARLDAQWQVRLASAEASLSSLLGAPGWLRLDASLPQPWPVPAIGLVSGELALDLHNSSGQWLAQELRADLLFDPQGAPWIADLPADLRPNQVHLKVGPGQSSLAPSDALALRLQVDGQGPLQVRGEADIALHLQSDWALDLTRLQLDARAARVQLAEQRLDDLHLLLQLSGQANAQHLDLKLGSDSRILIKRLRAGDIELQQLRAELSAISLQGPPQAPQLRGPLSLRAQRLQQPQLQAQGWQWQGQLQATGDQQSLDGVLLADAGLSLALRLEHDAKGELRADARLEELFLRAGNPLPKTLTAWPALLSLDNGRLQGKAQLRLTPGRAQRLQLALTSKGLGGIYDRSTFSGVDGELEVRLDGEQLSMDLRQLSAKQIDPGIALGPLQLRAQYRASVTAPLTGRLQHQHAELGILGGRLSLAAAEWQLDRASQLLPLRLEGLDLAELLRAYPAEGLEGSGLIDGLIPLRLGTGGPSVEQGLIEARAPGGRLRFHSPRIRAMGQANPGMKLVTDALEDFHYSLLSSSLDYDQSGTLKLGMRLQGQNPAIEQGRAIHFNINLEEDIPTLLASLQLADKVSEIIQQRIQQRMRQRIPQEPKE